MPTAVECKMDQSSMSNMDHDMSNMSHDMDHMNHDMSNMSHDMANMNHQLEQSADDCCEQNCACTMASCSSVVFGQHSFISVSLNYSLEKISARIFNISKPIQTSLYRPPITI
ncbi:hypothetical protein [Thalassotalea crassostreae]|uniref:hypothetical protein n=2 Tax=Thalassotalea crassostreae TaxID=1763536 RepID=UPI0012FD1A95|nr:hypothetical protein [Thalassotalea crassostreae]